ncbi:MAG: DEAD/DEAH box helicase [Thermodesulfobacteriota bacterium]|nr:DEAD/DEAH box helicase [Thermodesulfobacteriota bacterium]
MMIKKNDKPAVCYEQLRPVLKTVIQILAVQVFELRQKGIIYSLNSLGFRDDNDMPFVQSTFQPLLKELENQGFIIKNPNGVTCPESLWLKAIQDTVMADRFNKISKIVLEAKEFKYSYRGFFFESIKEFYRAVQIAVYGNAKYADIDDVYNSGWDNFPMEFQKSPPFLILFNRPFQPQLFNCLKFSMRLKVLGYLLDEAQKSLTPAVDAIDYCVQLLSKKPGLIENHTVMDSLLLSGNFSEHQKFVDRFIDSASGASRKAMVQVLCNNNEDALIYFKDALKTRKEMSRKQKKILPGYEGLFFLFALIKSKKKEDHRAAINYIKKDAETDSNPYLPVINAMKFIFYEKLDIEFLPLHFICGALKLYINRDNDVLAFFSILVITWIDKKQAESHIAMLENLKKKTEACGYLWMEAEICAMLAELGKDVTINKNRSTRIHKECGTTTLTAMVKPSPKWEQNLKSLINIGENSSKESKIRTDSKRQRLIWFLHHNEKYNTCYIAPRLQTMSKKGVWTKGRAVALKNLYQNYHTMEGLTDQDRQVCSTIMEESFQRGYHSYYYNIDYSFDKEKALPALAGHPLIFLENCLESPVELVMGEPEVSFRMNRKKINIQMHPMPERETDGLLVVRETPSRFKLVNFSSEHLKIAAILSKKGLTLPEKAEKMAGKAIASLSSLVNINSDLAAAKDKHVREIKADATPHVHVMPWQEGIKIEFFIRPFIDTGSYFRPGRGGINVFADVKGKKLQAIRNLSLEKKLSNSVIADCPSLDLLEEVGGQWLVGDTQEALELLFELKDSREEKVMEWPQGETIKVRSEVSFNDFTLNVQKDREWFKATGTLKIDENLSLDLAKLMELLDKPSGRFITMDDGTFLAITHSLKERLGELKAYSFPHGNGLRFAPLAAPAIEDFTDQVGSLKSDKAWKKHCSKLKEVIKPQVPGTLQASLRDYQKVGFNWLAQLVHWNVGACLADDMGLGKTVQAIAAMLLHAGNGPSLVVAPLSVMANWQEECRNFAPTLKPLVFGTGDRQKFLDDLVPFDLVISSYGLLQVEAEKLAGVDWQTIVLDEAQAIKNMKTKRSKAAMKLHAEFKMITTGTPVENHLDELWTLFNFLNPGLLGTFSHFKNSFALPIERDQDREAPRRLKKLIRPFILRRMKTQVLKELPEKTEITLQVEMSRDESILYEAQRLKAIENIENANDKPGQKHLRILAELTKLRQLCCNPALVLPDASIQSSKLKVFGDMVEELLENNHKALVFSQFVGHLSILRKLLDGKKISYQYLDGSTPVKERQKRIKAFQSGTGDLFLISLKAGGFGLNLTAADYVIHMDPWWNPAVEDQASDRAHRIGQTRPVTVYRLVVKDSIEEQILNLHKEKRDLAQTLLTGSDMAGKICAEDLMGLLQGN